jgi:C-terminal processing protease CtpA/Prc
MTALRAAHWFYWDQAERFSPDEIRRLDRWARASWWGDSPAIPQDGSSLYGLGVEEGTVRTVLPQSPAERAGIRPGARIRTYSADGGKSWRAAAQWPSGVGEQVWLRIERKAGVIKLAKAPWQAPGVIERGGGRIQIWWFGNGLVEEFTRTMTRAVNAAPGRRLDLRGSPGGYTESAAALLGLFLGPGESIGTYHFRDELGRLRNRDYLTPETSRRVFKPADWTILVDDRTASSAEVVAYTLEARGAKLEGGPTLGKREAVEITRLDDGRWLVCTVGRIDLASATRGSLQ